MFFENADILIMFTWLYGHIRYYSNMANIKHDYVLNTVIDNIAFRITVYIER